jgi:ssDNA-binding Zn-finger/Zn-ribbon topoisomerase 1
MNCPKCGTPMKTHQTPKGLTLVSCAKWQQCGMVATPQVFGMVDHYEAEATRLETTLRERKPAMAIVAQPVMDGPDPVPLGSFVVGVAQLAIHLSKLRRAKTAEERNTIRKQAMEAIK